VTDPPAAPPAFVAEDAMMAYGWRLSAASGRRPDDSVAPALLAILSCPSRPRVADAAPPPSTVARTLPRSEP